MMHRDLQQEADRADSEFKNQVFAANPMLYKKLFDKPADGDIPESNIEEVVPQSDDEVKRVLAKMKRDGFIA